MTNITPFMHPAFGQLRTHEEDGRILFCGRDAATALGYSNTKDALARHCKGVAKHYPLATPGGEQQFRFISEGDLYRLIAHSKLPAAVEFEAWVFDEVLPTIRQRGGYLTPEAAEEALTDPDFIIRLATDLKRERAARASLEAQAVADRPKVLFADAVSTSSSEILVGDLAKILRGNGIPVGANRLFAWLRNNGFLIRRDGSDWNMPTQKSMELELFRVKETAVVHSDGHTSLSKTPKVTGKGQQYFIDGFLSGRFSIEDGAA